MEQNRADGKGEMGRAAFSTDVALHQRFMRDKSRSLEKLLQRGDFGGGRGVGV